MYQNTTAHQPDVLADMLALRPVGADIPARPVDRLADRMAGAFLGRGAGCTLGVPVENHPILHMQAWAMETGTPFPPTDYWEAVVDPDTRHYGVCPRRDYSRAGLHEIPVDDDITYTILNLLLLEKYGKSYTVEDVGALWLDILPTACTAEWCALEALRKGTPAAEAAMDNDYIEWIGAAIRADAFGYAAAGDPVGAAKLCYNDAYLTHRQNGIYGEMFCAASIAAAFVADTPLDAVRTGMTQIPAESELYRALSWALEQDPANYIRARLLLDEHFAGMHPVHTINNMCAIVFALKLGGMDLTSCLSNCIAMGLDNDCTGATVGSIVGACIGLRAIPPHWYTPFGDTVRTYIRGYDSLSIRDVIRRFVALNG